MFTYGSLYSRSGIEDDDRLSATFRALETTDFELAIKSLELSALVTPIYGGSLSSKAEMLRDADRLKDILVSTVAANHSAGPFEMTDDELRSCRDFLYNFISSDRSGYVFTVNYDLLLYWALMKSDSEEDLAALKVNDGFGSDEDDPTADYVIWDGETRAHAPSIYYLHGALHLFDASSQLQKFTWVRTGERLVDQARRAMRAKKFPLFVSEGTTEQKLDKIRHNAYLYQGLKTLTSNASQSRHCFFVHGHSLDENDRHIFEKIGRGKCGKLYVSVHGELSDPSNVSLVRNVRALQALRSSRFPLDVAFYDASSARVWDRF